MVTEIGLIGFCRVIPVDSPVGLLFFEALPQYTFHHFAVLPTQGSAEIATLRLLSLNGLLKFQELLAGGAGVTF